MKFLLDFWHQNVPKARGEMPAYYRNALVVCNQLFAVYLPLCFLLVGLLVHRWEVVPAVLFAVAVALMLCVDRFSMRVNLLAFTGITVLWCGWYVYMFGWNGGVQLLLVPLVLLIFFAICEPPWLKLVLFLLLVALRMLLFDFSQEHAAVCAPDSTAAILLQNLNTVTAFVMLACECILFSTNTQATERQLRLDNQTLHHKAETDPLTLLPNRRALIEEINQFLQKEPTASFGVAIADIDFFKKVNDTYGHNCGDYTLKVLADLFREKTEGKNFSVCRWGGEEFCFFMPYLNLDEAAQEMFSICAAVRRMPLSYEDVSFSITITIGVAENDFRSPMQAILDEADKKLYIGKASGRDQVVA